MLFILSFPIRFKEQDTDSKRARSAALPVSILFVIIRFAFFSKNTYCCAASIDCSLFKVAFFKDCLKFETDETSPDDDLYEQFEYEIVSR